MVSGQMVSSDYIFYIISLHNKFIVNQFGGSIMKRVSYLGYQVAKAIYRKVVLISASDKEALIFIYK